MSPSRELLMKESVATPYRARQCLRFWKPPREDSVQREFARDLKGVRDKKLWQRVKENIEAVEKADSLSNLPNLKKTKRRKELLLTQAGRLSHQPRTGRRHLSRLCVSSIEKTSTNTFRES